jgi:hypothetical protein
LGRVWGNPNYMGLGLGRAKSVSALLPCLILRIKTERELLENNLLLDIGRVPRVIVPGNTSSQVEYM